MLFCYTLCWTTLFCVVSLCCVLVLLCSVLVRFVLRLCWLDDVPCFASGSAPVCFALSCFDVFGVASFCYYFASFSSLPVAMRRCVGD